MNLKKECVNTNLSELIDRLTKELLDNFNSEEDQLLVLNNTKDNLIRHYAELRESNLKSAEYFLQKIEYLKK